MPAMPASDSVPASCERSASSRPMLSVGTAKHSAVRRSKAAVVSAPAVTMLSANTIMSRSRPGSSSRGTSTTLTQARPCSR